MLTIARPGPKIENISISIIEFSAIFLAAQVSGAGRLMDDVAHAHRESQCSKQKQIWRYQAFDYLLKSR